MPHRIFISFAVPEDNTYRDFLVGQARNKNSPFEFVDMSVKDPYSESWKTQCRTKIKGCDGMIALISKATNSSGGARWEIGCANQENIPVLGVHTQKDNKGTIPSELNGKKVIDWTWEGISSWLSSL